LAITAVRIRGAVWLAVAVGDCAGATSRRFLVGGVFSLAFLDSCPPEHCSADGAATTVIRLARRRPGWPFAVATLGACAVVGVCGVIAYAAATGMTGPPNR
jgi:hypothetical protein